MLIVIALLDRREFYPTLQCIHSAAVFIHYCDAFLLMALITFECWPFSWCQCGPVPTGLATTTTVLKFLPQPYRIN